MFLYQNSPQISAIYNMTEAGNEVMSKWQRKQAFWSRNTFRRACNLWHKNTVSTSFKHELKITKRHKTKEQELNHSMN